MTPERLILIAMVIMIGASVVTLALWRLPALIGGLAVFATIVSAALVLVAAVSVLQNGPSGQTETLFPVPHLGFALHIAVDGLSAVFLLLAVTVAAPAALYSLGYMRRYPVTQHVRYYPNFLFFLAALYGLITTTDMMWFLFIFWQMMTIPGYLLIRFERDNPANRKASNQYMLMMQIACVAAMVGAEMLIYAGFGGPARDVLRYSVEGVREVVPKLLSERPVLTTVAFALFFVGFGIKAGMWPFGSVWLPQAHPAAPSPVSAVLSGVMIKTGVYGMLRYFLCLVPAEARSSFPLEMWGTVLAVTGTITLITGTAAALREEYTKRLLAFHSIGQVGYIFLAGGTCLVLLGSENGLTDTMAAGAFMAAVLHSFNHAAFKALLFLNAGSLLHATDTQDLNRLGGLWRFMPITALTAVIASLAISGFPLLNGFVSKWMIYTTSLQGSMEQPFLAICAALALLTSALTLASFVKFFGSSFLGVSSALVRDRAGQQGKLEVGAMMQVPQVFLALVCLGTGIVPAWLIWAARQTVAGTREGLTSWLPITLPVSASPATGVGWNGQVGNYVPLALLFVFAVTLLVAWLVSRLGGAPRRRDEPWLCGYVTQKEDLRYTAHHLYGEVKTLSPPKQGHSRE